MNRNPFSRLGSGLTGNISAQSLALLVQLVVALITILFVALVLGLVISRDVVWLAPGTEHTSHTETGCLIAVYAEAEEASLPG